MKNKKILILFLIIIIFISIFLIINKPFYDSKVLINRTKNFTIESSQDINDFEQKEKKS